MGTRGTHRADQDVSLGTVLVVGGGNTGYQIADELSATHAVHLSMIAATEVEHPNQPEAVTTR